MSSKKTDAISIAVSSLGKCYSIYASPQKRLIQMFIRGYRKLDKDFWALRGVTFELRKGETIGIIGKNGSGKSTLLQLICGTLTPTEGKVTVNGRVAALLELGAGFNPEFTGRENVYLSAALYGLSRSETDAKMHSIENFAEIGVFIDQPVKTYSSGMFVRLAFAVIANVDADILIIDEALAVGDALFTQKCMRFLRAFKAEKTLLFVSHDTASVINLCDRALWLDQGKVLAYGPSKEIAELYLAHLFGVLPEETDPRGDLRSKVAAYHARKEVQWRDKRADLVNSSSLRNDLEIFKFSAETEESFGKRGAHIVDVYLRDHDGSALNWIIGGEVVTLKVIVQSVSPLNSPIVGFYIKDRLGQTLFGDNTYISYAGKPCSIGAGELFCAEFKFPMPWLAQGDYSIAVAVANGTQSDHEHQHWIHDALLFRSHHDPLSTGIVGIPMIDISLYKVESINE